MRRLRPIRALRSGPMETSIRLGRVAGIEIGVNWSWFAIFALLVWTLSEGILPDQNPGLSHGAYLAMAIVATVCFFTSLLAHELGHALVARREGMQIEGITLWLFGGVAKFRGSFPSAGAEFRIAIAGPLVSLAIGVTLILVALARLPVQVDGVVSWLGYINLFLLAFNMLPALPLDGGRVLRSALWRWQRDYAKATRLAANVGRGFGLLFVAAGIFLLIFEGEFSGAWLAFIGWFLLQAAGSEARYALTRQALAGVRVRDLMSREPATVEPHATLGAFMDGVAWSRRFTTYPVVDDGRVLGLLAFRGVAEVPRAEWDTRTVASCMIPRERVPVVHEDDEAEAALAALMESGVHRAFVLEGERLVGLLSITDVLRALDVAAPRRRRAA